MVSRYVQLKKGGANFQGLCPFHTEKSPSFTVSPAKQFYHCFGCGQHGNAIGFLMAYAGMGYVEAVKDLAASAGLTVPEDATRQRPKEQTDREQDLYALIERAMEFYRAELKKSDRAIAYLKGRGLTGEIAARFRIGYAPDDWQGLKAAFPEYEDKALVDAGLVIAGEGKRYDRFRDRVMFPIFNARGAAIGFGGRVMGEGEPKYLNSPETVLFEKGRELYGLVQARDAMRTSSRVLVVEGYMDVVSLAQFGVGYAVATLGTATTPTHVGKLLRLADEIVFCFDGDAAGRKAAWRALEVSLPLALDHKPLRFLFLPEGDDPDSYVRKHGRERIRAPCGRGADALGVPARRAARRQRSRDAGRPFALPVRGQAAPAEDRGARIEAADGQGSGAARARVAGGGRAAAGDARHVSLRAPGTGARAGIAAAFAGIAIAEIAVDPAEPCRRARSRTVRPGFARGQGDRGARRTLRSGDREPLTQALLIEAFAGSPHAELLERARASMFDIEASEEVAEQEFRQIQLVRRIKRKKDELAKFSGVELARRIHSKKRRRTEEPARLSPRGLKKRQRPHLLCYNFRFPFFSR